MMQDDTVGALLAARDVVFDYGGNEVVCGVTLELVAGEILGLIGPNGSGKSTLIRMLSGVLTPTAGRIELAGRPMREIGARERARAIAVVPQETSVEMPFTVMEAVLMGRSPHLGGFAFEGDTDVAAARRAMERTGVEHLARRSLHQLSGGERQRVILARALAQEARVLLLDEPGAFLDLRHAVELYDLLQELRDEGRAILTVLHDLNLAALYCDRIGLMKDGRLVRFGTPAEVITYTAITEVYETDVYVDRNDITGAINVLPLSRRYREMLRGRDFSAPTQHARDDVD